MHKKYGRPPKKPGYHREIEIQNFTESAANLAAGPFDDGRDPELPTMTEIAEEMGTTLLRVRKMLITADFYTSEKARNVLELTGQGYSIADIMVSTGLKNASVNSYLPYQKGGYNLTDPTLYAEQGESGTVRGKERLKKTLGVQVQALQAPGLRIRQMQVFYLWQAVVAFE